MAKKGKTGEVPTSDAGALKHNPFAALGSLPVAPAQPSAPADPAAATPTKAAAPSTTPVKRGRVVLRRETKHRGGKAVIIVTGLSALPAFSEQDARELAQALKQALGCGGTVEDHAGQREIVLQGDRPARVAELLRARGFRVDGVTS